jgi:hypothetical protein
MDYNRENKKGTFSVEADKKWDDQVNTPSSRKSVSHLSSAQRLGDKRNKSVSSLTKSEKRGTRGGKEQEEKEQEEQEEQEEEEKEKEQEKQEDNYSFSFSLTIIKGSSKLGSDDFL